MRKISESAEQTRDFGEAWGKKLKRGRIIALSGELGSGKTTFVKGLARGLGLRHKIKSPTFVIFSVYPLRRKKQNFYHFDLYRLATSQELEHLGFWDIIKNQNNIIVLEWPEKIKNSLPAKTQYIHFSHVKRKPHQRFIRIS